MRLAVSDPTPLRPPSAALRLRTRIFVRDLVLPCAIGVHAHEQSGTQRVRVNVDLEVLEPGAALNDDIRNVVSYEAIVEGIRTLVARGHINLVETLASQIADLCLADPRSARVRVRIEKLDIYAEAASVGVEIERARS